MTNAQQKRQISQNLVDKKGKLVKKVKRQTFEKDDKLLKKSKKGNTLV